MNFNYPGGKAFAFFVILFLFSGFKSFGGSLAGADLFASATANGRVVIMYQTFQDCAGTVPPDSILVNLRAVNCQADTSFFLRRTGIGISVNPYCPTVGNACNATAATNLRKVYYSVNKPLSAAQLQCNEWIISVKDYDRYPVANLQNSNTGSIYSEAYLNLLGGNKDISSPVFNAIPHLFVTAYSQASLSNLITNQNTLDSVVYTLKPAQADSNITYPYLLGTTYQSPLPSSSNFSLHPNTGMLYFTPSMYMPPVTQGANTYSVVIEAAAYRKINGAIVKVSASQRNLPVFVVDNNPNENPEIRNVMANGRSISPNSIVDVPAGNIFRLEFNTFDLNAGNNLEIMVPEFLLAGYNFTLQTGTWPAGTVTGRGSATPDSIVQYYPITVRDSNCPVRGTVTHVYGIRTVANVTGIKADQNSGVSFQAVPNPFSDEVTFHFNARNKPQTIIIYNLLGQETDRISVNASGENNSKTVWKNAPKLAPGTYVARLISEDKTVQTLKFTKLQ